jgi:rhodanese-related sulfurtransferase
MVLALALGAAGLPARAQEGYTNVGIEQVRTEVAGRKAVLVDVREPKEWARGHLRDAVSIPLSDLMAWDRDGLSAAEKAALQKAVPPGSVVYCHCAAGARALSAGELLTKLGYRARPLRQGYRDLVQAGFVPAPSGR